MCVDLENLQAHYFIRNGDSESTRTGKQKGIKTSGDKHIPCTPGPVQTYKGRRREKKRKSGNKMGKQRAAMKGKKNKQRDGHVEQTRNTRHNASHRARWLRHRHTERQHGEHSSGSPVCTHTRDDRRRGKRRPHIHTTTNGMSTFYVHITTQPIRQTPRSQQYQRDTTRSYHHIPSMQTVHTHYSPNNNSRDTGRPDMHCGS
jgi:hypothetical protein